MSAQANIVLNDGQTTPVAHTFNPKGARTQPNGKSVALWRDQSQANAEGYWTLKEEHTPPNGNGMEKFRFIIDRPTLESPASGGSFVPPPTRAFGSIGVVEIWVHKRALDAELKDIAALVKNFTATTYFTDAIVKREPAW
jgi:hypothetical protein